MSIMYTTYDLHALLIAKCFQKTKLNDGVFLVQITGWARFLSYDHQVMAMCIYVGHLAIMCYTLPAQYYFRYHAIAQ